MDQRASTHSGREYFFRICRIRRATASACPPIMELQGRMGKKREWEKEYIFINYYLLFSYSFWNIVIYLRNPLLLFGLAEWLSWFSFISFANSRIYSFRSAKWMHTSVCRAFILLMRAHFLAGIWNSMREYRCAVCGLWMWNAVWGICCTHRMSVSVYMVDWNRVYWFLLISLLSILLTARVLQQSVQSNANQCTPRNKWCASWVFWVFLCNGTVIATTMSKCSKYDKMIFNCF